MGKIIVDISMSLDGFVTASGQTAEEPMGPGGSRVHDWFASTDERDQQLIREGLAPIGAMVAGRRTYDTSVPWWQADGPSGPARLPVVVLTHDAPADVPVNGVYRFATGGVEDAARTALEAAGGRDVAVMGGAETIQAFLNAGLVDEIGLHVAPVMFGSGTRLFDHLTIPHTELEPVSATPATSTMHLRYRLAGRGRP